MSIDYLSQFHFCPRQLQNSNIPGPPATVPELQRVRWSWAATYTRDDALGLRKPRCAVAAADAFLAQGLRAARRVTRRAAGTAVCNESSKHRSSVAYRTQCFSRLNGTRLAAASLASSRRLKPQERQYHKVGQHAPSYSRLAKLCKVCALLAHGARRCMGGARVSRPSFRSSA